MKVEVYLLSSGTLHSDEVNTIFILKVGKSRFCMVGINPVLSSGLGLLSGCILQQAALAGI